MEDDDLLKYWQERQTTAQSYNLQLSKWILATLIAVNGGPFVLLSKNGFKDLLGVRDAAMVFACGLAAAILCGFCAWVNTGMREARAGEAIEQYIRTRELLLPMAITKQRAVIAGYIGAIVTGFASLGLFLAGASMLTDCAP